MARYIAVELSTCRDPADDRPLGVGGAFLSGSFTEKDVAAFVSMHSALNAASQATNARDGAAVEAIAQGRRVSA